MHIFTLQVGAESMSGSWGRRYDMKFCETPDVYASSADQVASKLEIPGFNGDLLIKYVLAHLQPTLQYNGSAPLKYWVDGLKAEGMISIKPQQHLWYDAWNYTLK